MKPTVSLVTVSLLFAPISFPGPGAETLTGSSLERSWRNDQKAYGRKGAVVSAHPLASRVGLAILKRGGNAVDAAVATFLTLAVVHPQAGNLGGGGFVVLRMADGRKLALDFREMAPLKAHPKMYQDGKGEVIPGKSLRTAQAVGVPGSPAGIYHLWKKFGKIKKWSQLVYPAHAFAEKGFEVDDFLARSIRAKRKTLGLWPATREIFFRKGEPLRKGDFLIQKDLAATLKRFADGGPKGFYGGRTAELFEAEMKRTKGMITQKDLASYVVKERKVLEGSYRGYPILSMPPPSSGGIALLQMLHILETWSLRDLGPGSAQELHYKIEAMRRAYADRARWLGDPDFFKVPIKGLLAKDYATGLAEGISPTQASKGVEAGLPAGAPPEESRETTHFSVIDAEGNAVSCTTTLNSTFGNGQVVAGAGFLLNNEMDDFSSKPGVPNQFGLVGAKANEIRAGKRPLSSMTPTIVLDKKGEHPYLILGSPGGGRIINTVLQVLIQVLDHDLPLDLAVRAPRIHQQWLPPATYWEPLAIPADARRKLEGMGHLFQKRPSVIGRCQAIRRDARGRILAVSDPRSGGGASAW